MTKFLLLLLSIRCAVFASGSTHLETAEALEQAVRTTANGAITEGVEQIFVQGPGSRSPKERSDLAQKFKSTLEDVRKLGASRRVTRVSLVAFGDGYYRLRILDRRSSGAILWTFVCEQDSDRWYMTSSRLNADEEIGELIRELDAADFSKDESS